MNRAFTTLVLAAFLLTAGTSAVKAQSDMCCGTDLCLSWLLASGVYVGYGAHTFSADGLNKFIDVYNSQNSAAGTLKSKLGSFGTASGFTVGANFLNLVIDPIIFYATFRYSSYSQSNSAELTTGTREYKLSSSNIGMGIGISFILTPQVDLKVMETMLTTNKVKLVSTLSGTTNSERTSEADGGLGITLESGLVFYPAPPNLSIDISAGYHLYTPDAVSIYTTSGATRIDDTMSNGGWLFTARVMYAFGYGD